jgi:hypothetical protein
MAKWRRSRINQTSRDGARDLPGGLDCFESLRAERDHRIDPTGPERWYPARQEGHGREQECDADKSYRIDRIDAVEHALEQSSRSECL